jgi:hypothetical protein
VRRLISLSITNATATIEQRIKGQIGQPAACMIENKGVPGVCWGGQRGGDYGPKARHFRPLPQRRKRALRPIHRNCGKHCGQLAPAAAQSAQLLARERFAASLSREFSLSINHLHEYVMSVTGLVGAPPDAGATVEFSHRSIVCGPHG